MGRVSLGGGGLGLRALVLRLDRAAGLFDYLAQHNGQTGDRREHRSERFMLDYSEEAICMNSSPLARGENVRVVKGPLTGLVGELVNVDGKSKIAVRLNMLGCACVNMPIGYVEAICEKN